MNKDLKRRMVTAFQKYVLNPVAKLAPWPIGPNLIETTGRRSGKPRRNPVGMKKRDDAYWIVTEHGRRSNYVRNIEADAQVRVKYHGHWHEGTARIVEGADPRPLLRSLNGLIVRLVGTELLVIRIDPNR